MKYMQSVYDKKDREESIAVEKTKQMWLQRFDKNDQVKWLS